MQKALQQAQAMGAASQGQSQSQQQQHSVLPPRVLRLQQYSVGRGGSSGLTSRLLRQGDCCLAQSTVVWLRASHMPCGLVHKAAP